MIIKAVADEIEKMQPLKQLENKLSSPTLIDKAMPSIEKHIDEFLNVKLQQEIPMLAMFIGNKTTDKVKSVFINQLKELFPQVMTTLWADAKETLRLDKLVSEKLNEVDFRNLSQTSFSVFRKKYELTGLLGGLIIGIINVLVLLLTKM